MASQSATFSAMGFSQMTCLPALAARILVGEVADAISKRFNATTPIYIDVSTEKRYAQPGCSRLNVRFWQDGVQLPNYGAGGVQAPRRQTIDFGINYCRDGQPPRSLS